MLQTVNDKKMLSDGWYAFGKRAVQVYIPAVSSLYFGLGSIWGLPAVEEVVGTLAVFATFFGIILGVSSSQYDKSGAAYDGNAVINDKPNGGKQFSLELNGDPYDLLDKTAVRFKVVQGSSAVLPQPEPPTPT